MLVKCNDINNGHLVTPPLHLDALSIIAGELAIWIAASQLQHRGVRSPLVARVTIIGYRPSVFSKHIRDFAGLGHGCYRRRDVGQLPETVLLLVLDPCGCPSYDQHVAGVVRQLLWREERVDSA